MKLKITAIIEVEDDTDGEAIEGIREEFEDVADLYSMIGIPKVIVQELE